MRKVIKMVSSKPEKFIPKSHLEDLELNENDPDIMKRPLVFMIRKLSRDEQFRLREMIEFKDETNPTKGILGTGDVAKYIWERCIIEVRNAIIKDGDEVMAHESLTAEAKNALWDTDGMDAEITEAIMFARSSSDLSEAEAKN